MGQLFLRRKVGEGQLSFMERQGRGCGVFFSSLLLRGRVGAGAACGGAAGGGFYKKRERNHCGALPFVDNGLYILTTLFFSLRLTTSRMC